MLLEEWGKSSGKVSQGHVKSLSGIHITIAFINTSRFSNPGWVPLLLWDCYFKILSIMVKTLLISNLLVLPSLWPCINEGFEQGSQTSFNQDEVIVPAAFFLYLALSLPDIYTHKCHSKYYCYQVSIAKWHSMPENWINRTSTAFPSKPSSKISCFFFLISFIHVFLICLWSVPGHPFWDMKHPYQIPLALALPDQTPPGSESLVCPLSSAHLQESSGMEKILSKMSSCSVIFFNWKFC